MHLSPPPSSNVIIFYGRNSNVIASIRLL